MARTTGPLMSLGASGSVAKTLTFSTWKGRPYVRQLVTPSNPRSTAQYYTRAMMTFLSKTWAMLPAKNALYQPTWDHNAKALSVSPFNAYTQYNMKRWTQGTGAKTDALTIGGSTADVITGITPTAGVGQISLSGIASVANDGFGYAIALDPANSATPALTQTRLIIPAPGLTASLGFSGLLSNLAPGTYSICNFQFTQDGTIAARSQIHQGLVVT